ncbi:MAG: hypothetical protein JWO90_1134, partial [Solirubrobacterales bacterium]|nr:hypothetical protein [Solirubrobacterales bacterium]
MEVERRRDRLARFLAPLDCRFTTTWSAGVALVGWAAGGTPPSTGSLPAFRRWGERLPVVLDDAGALLEA